MASFDKRDKWTAEHYKAYQEAIERNLEGLEAVSTGACPGCAQCGLEDCEDMDCEECKLACESSFSWSPCDCCGSSLGGDRHPAHYIIPDKNGSVAGQDIEHMDVCSDCVYYLSYSQLDDMSMLDIEEES